MDGCTLTAPGRWGVLRRAIGIWLAVALALGTVVVPEAWAADYYVDPTGDDTDPGTAAAPWKTLTYALGQVTSGDVIHAAAGTYDEAGNGETFPLTLVDGVEIVGAGAGSSVIEAPWNEPAFFNDDTPLSSATRLTGFTLQHDGASTAPLMTFAVGTATMSPQIDHTTFAGIASDDDGIAYYDASTGSGTFTPTIDNNTFTSLQEGIVLSTLSAGPDQVFSPTITNNTFTDCTWGVKYTMISSSGEGTVGGLVAGNTFTGTAGNDIFVSFSPYSGGSGLVFNPTITGNDMQSGAQTNVFAYLYGYYYSGDATFAPTISDNRMSCTHRNIYHSGYYDYHDGDYTVAPVISGNTMTGAMSDAVMISMTTLSVSTTAQRNVFSPTITNNTITANGGDGISISLTDWSHGQLEGTVTIAGNTISGASDGIYLNHSYMSDGHGLDYAIVISNNTITSPQYDGISISMSSWSYSGAGIFDLTIEGNTITEPGDDGIEGYPAYSWYSDNVTAQTVLVRGNTVTGATYDGMDLYLSDQTSNTLDMQVTDNVIEGGADGFTVYSADLGSNGIMVACNVITGNSGYGIEQRYGNDPPADYGGGNLGSAGGNVLIGNTGFDFYNDHADPVSAQSNWWGTTDGPTIDGNISDDEELTGGAVDFSSFLSAAPTVTLAATLTDAVAVDVAPAGASIGDTLLYTAVIDSSGSCGDASATFTAPVDANTTVVPGSVTSTRGNVQSEDPPTVAIGVIGGGETVTITWQVTVDAGTSVETQGTVSATRTGSTLSDDPDTATATDPTVTPLVVAQAGTVQFALAAASVAEGDGSVTLDVTRTGGTAGSITVNFASADGSAVAPGDYTAASGQLTWADGDATTQQIVVPIVDDTDVEPDETFTVTLTDQAAASFVGTPATATVTIQDDDGVAIPTLSEWGLVLFAGALLLLGLGVLRRRVWTGAAMVLLLATAVAVPVAADEAKKPPKDKDVYVTTVSSMLAKDGAMVLTLADEGVLSVPASRVKVREGHVKPPRGAKADRTRAEMTREERRAERHARRAAWSPSAVSKVLATGTPALVVVKKNLERGTVERVKITTFRSLEDAHAELRRKEEGRKHPRK